MNQNTRKIIPVLSLFLLSFALFTSAKQINLSQFKTDIKNQQSNTLSAIHNIYQLDLENSSDDDWVKFHQESDMELYYQKDHDKKDGRIIEPIALFYEIDGVSAFEVANVFHGLEHKKEVDRNILKFDFKIVDRNENGDLNENDVTDEGSTMIMNQFMDTIWPASNREAYYLSNMDKISPEDDNINLGTKNNCVLDTWIVNNFSLDDSTHFFEKFEKSSVRVELTISLLVQTIVKNTYPPDCPQQSQITNLSRDQFKTKVTYISRVDPGGWVPAGILKSIYKDEYPAFLYSLNTLVKDAIDGHDQVNMSFEDWEMMMENKLQVGTRNDQEKNSWWG